jgi:outer membrane protein
MNKNISLGLNIVLIIAVAILFYLHFSGSPAQTESAGVAADSAALAKPVVAPPKDIKDSKIVYVNMDILNEKYEYLKDITSAARTEQSSLENQYQSKGEKLQNDYMAFQQKVQQGLLSENQANAEQESLMKRKEEIDQLELKSQKLMEKIQGQAEEAHGIFKKYLEEYNKNNTYTYVMGYSDAPGSTVLLADPALDITQEILDGLNEQYKAKKAGNKK